MFKETESGNWLDPKETDALTENTPETKERITEEHIETLIRARIDLMLQKKETLLGTGGTAEAHAHEENPLLCFKVTTERSAYGQNIPEPNIILTSRDNRTPVERYHNGPEKEGNFLSELEGVDDSVIIPTPYAWATYEDEYETAEYFSKEKIHVLVMESLDAITFKSILEGENEIPSGFNEETFFNNIRSFLNTMHQRGIYHRDLHEGNIMIDNKTGKPCIIDFGRSAKGSESDVYEFSFAEKGKVQKGVFTRDEEYIDSIERKYHLWKNERDLTK